MKPVIDLFGLHISTYGLMTVVGAFTAFLLSVALRRVSPARFKDFTNVFFIALCGGIFGAVLFRPLTKLPFLLIHIRNFDSFESVYKFLFGEIVFYGGALGGLLGIVLFCKGFRLSVADKLDLAAPCVCLAHSFGRIGCLMGGCCFGHQLHEGDAFFPISIIYPDTGLYDDRPDIKALLAPAGVPLLPVPLMESVFLLFLSALLCLIFVIAYRKPTPKIGVTFSVYVVLYAVWRFVIEFGRGDKIRGSYLLLSTSQWTSVAAIVGVVAFGVWVNKKQVIANA
jgi:phosphatidylglycerol:prolipoprotein diacylglycerol transferase